MLISSDEIHNGVEDTAHSCCEYLPVSLAVLKGREEE